MQAGTGLRASIRGSGRLIGCLIALALVASATLPSMASAAKKTLPVKEQYLALGDSLAFGYSTQLYHEGEVAGYEDPELFEHNYVNAYAKKLAAKAKKAGGALKVVNDGCPGETTESLIGTNTEIINALNAALKKSQEENGLPPVTGESPCAYQEAWNAYKTVGIGGPLHHPYVGKSQLEDAINVLYNAQKVEKKPVTTISLNIGANDELHTLGKVEGEATAYVTAKVTKVGEEAVKAKLAKVAEEAVKAKLAKVAQEAVEAKINEQVYIKCSEKAFAATGGEEPAYAEKREECLTTEGKQLGEQYYAEHQSQLEQEGQEAAGKYYGEHQAQLEKEGEQAAGQYYYEHKAQLEKEGKEAGEKYYAEHKFELGAEGEAFASEHIQALLPGLYAQINSNISGILLALRDGESLGLKGGKAINYTGRIIFQLGYDPYGKLFHYAYEGVQFVEEHGGLTGPYASIIGRCEVHSATQKEEEEKIASGCTAAEVHEGFNSLVADLNKLEVQTVHGGYAACTANPEPAFNPGTQAGEPERLKEWTNMTNGTKTNGKWNGPDIHPTPAGYEELGKLMTKETNAKCHKEGLPGF
jgi:lysophospholipase L1-like esterase